MKTRWFVYDKKSGKLKYYRSEQEEKANEFPLGQLDLSTATFNYDLERDVNGEFSIMWAVKAMIYIAKDSFITQDSNEQIKGVKVEATFSRGHMSLI